MARQHAKLCTHGDPHPRRSFLGASFALTATALGGAALTEVADAAVLTKAQRAQLTPDAVLALMKRGNKRFTSASRKDYNYLAQQRKRVRTVSRRRAVELYRLARAGRNDHGPADRRHFQH